MQAADLPIVSRGAVDHRRDRQSGSRHIASIHDSLILFGQICTIPSGN